MSASWESTFVF